MRSCVHERRVLRRTDSQSIVSCQPLRIVRGVDAVGVPSSAPWRARVQPVLLDNKLDFNLRRLVAARAVDDAVGCGIRRRRPLLRPDIRRLPSNTQPRARDTADDVSPKSAPEVDVQKTSEPLVEAQPYR